MSNLVHDLRVSAKCKLWNGRIGGNQMSRAADEIERLTDVLHRRRLEASAMSDKIESLTGEVAERESRIHALVKTGTEWQRAELAEKDKRILEIESYRRTPDEMRAALVREEQSHLETLHELDEKSARIRELESALAGHAKIDHCHGDDDGVPCVSHLAYLDVTNNEGGTWITIEQIDAAWKENKAGGLNMSEEVLGKLGVVRCLECGGSGAYSMARELQCRGCHGHGWAIEEVSDE